MKIFYSQSLGGPLLTVETEVNGGFKSTNERGPSLVGSLGLSCRYKIILFCFGCPSRPSTNIFLLTIRYFNAFVPISQQAGQAVVLSRLFFSMCSFIEKKSIWIFQNRKI